MTLVWLHPALKEKQYLSENNKSSSFSLEIKAKLLLEHPSALFLSSEPESLPVSSKDHGAASRFASENTQVFIERLQERILSNILLLHQSPISEIR